MKRGLPAINSPMLKGMQPVNVLVRIDGLDDGVLADVVGQWQLHQDAVIAGVIVKAAHYRERIVLRCVGGQHDCLGDHARLDCGALLHAHVHSGCGIVADEHDSESGGDAVLGAHLRDDCPDFCAHFRGYARAVNQGCGHVVYVLSGCPIACACKLACAFNCFLPKL